MVRSSWLAGLAVRPVSAAPAAPLVTDVVTLEVAVSGGERTSLALDLYGDAAPASVQFLVELASGQLRAECGEASEGLAPARVKAGQRNLERACLDTQGRGVSLVGSQVWRIVPNRRVDFGRVSSDFAFRVPPELPTESTGLGHTRGAVSVRRGGGAFEFSIAPNDNPALDKEDLVVVGHVSPASLDALDVIANLPSKKNPFGNAAVPPLGSSFARACEYSSPDPTCAEFKPLRKVVVTRATTTSLRV